MSQTDYLLAQQDLGIQMDALSTVDTKLENLQKRKQEKLDKLANIAKTGDIWTDTNAPSLQKDGTYTIDGVGTFSNKNKIYNDANAADWQYMFGKAAAEDQLIYDNGRYYKPTVDELGNEQRQYYPLKDVGLVYQGKTKDGATKVGYVSAYSGATPEEEVKNNYAHFTKGHKGGYRPDLGDEVQMVLAFPKNVAHTLEETGHGRLDALKGRTYQMGAPEKYTKDLGRGYTEEYNDGSYWGDARNTKVNENASIHSIMKTVGREAASIPAKATNTQPLLDALKERESSGDYKADNIYGYVGAYQFGASRLADLGVVKRGTKNSDLDDPKVWTGKYGFTSKEKFLNDAKGQDKLAKVHVLDLARQLKGSATDSADLSGKIFAAHLLGVQGSKNLNKKDGNGTSGMEYYKLGYGLNTAATQPQQSELPEQSIGDKISNFLPGVAQGFLKTGILDTADFVGEALKKYTGHGWDVGNEAKKEGIVSKWTGYDDTYTKKYSAAIQKVLAANAHEIKEEDKGAFDKFIENFSGKDGALTAINNILSNIDKKDTINIMSNAFANTDMTAYSLGMMAGLVVGTKGLGLGKVGVTAGKTASEAIKAVKATKELSRAQKATAIADIYKEAASNANILQKSINIAGKNTGLLVVNAGQVNDQLDEFEKNTGRKANTKEIASKYLLNLGGLYLDRLADVSIVKGTTGDVVNAVGSMIKYTPSSIGMKLAKSAVKAAGKITAESGLEFAQEGVQTAIEEANKVDLSTEKGKELFRQKAVDILNAAFSGAGGAVHMGAPTTLSSLGNEVIDSVAGTKSPKADIEKAVANIGKIEEKMASYGSTPIETTEGFEEFDPGVKYSKDDILSTVLDMASNPKKYPETDGKKAFMQLHKNEIQDIFAEAKQNAEIILSSNETKAEEPQETPAVEAEVNVDDAATVTNNKADVLSHIADVIDGAEIDTELLNKYEKTLGADGLTKAVQEWKTTKTPEAKTQMLNILNTKVNNDIKATNYSDKQKSTMEQGARNLAGLGAGIEVATWKTAKQAQIDTQTSDTVDVDTSVNRKHKRMNVLSDNGLWDIAVNGNLDAVDEIRDTDSKLEGDVFQKLDAANRDSVIGEAFDNIAKKVGKIATNSTEFSILNNSDDKKSAAFRLATVTLNQVNSSVTSAKHEAINEGALDIPDGAAEYKVAAQIGKDYVHSYGLTLTGGPKDRAKAYTKIGMQGIKLAEKLGIITSQPDGLIYNTSNIQLDGGDGTAKPAQLGLKSKTDLKNDRVVAIGKVLKVADMIDGESKNANAFRKLKPMLNIGNTEVPSKTMVDKDYNVLTDKKKLSSVQEKAVRNLINKPLKIKPEVVKLFDQWATKYKKGLQQGDTIDAFLADTDSARLMLGIVGTNGDNFLNESIAGANWAKKQNFRDILDNWDYLKKDKLYFEYKVDVNERISLINNILNFQHDKVIARNIITSNEQSVITTKKQLKFAVNEIADELKSIAIKASSKTKKQKQQDRVNAILNEGVDNELDFTLKEVFSNDNAVADNLATEITREGSPIYGMSGFKALSLLHAIKNIREGNLKDGIKTNYMFGADASASGVMNTLINVVGLSANNTERNKLIKMLRSFGVYFNGKKPKNGEAYQDPYEVVIDAVNASGKNAPRRALRALKEVGIDIRDTAKAPVMTWFYGQHKKNVKAGVGQDIALRVFKVANGLAKGDRVAARGILHNIKGLENVVIGEMTRDEYNIASKHFADLLGGSMVSALEKTFPQVVTYRGLMNKNIDKVGNVYSRIQQWFKGQWKGQFPGAVTRLLNKKTDEDVSEEETLADEGSYMSVQKKKNVLLQEAEKEGDIPLMAYWEMNNRTSLAVNNQHSEDAALLLASIGGLKNGAMTVHDATYGTIQDILGNMDEYNKGYLKLPKIYDFLEQAYNLLGTFDTSGLDKANLAKFKWFRRELMDNIKENKKLKDKLLTDKTTAEIYGLKEANMGDIVEVDLKDYPAKEINKKYDKQPTKYSNDIASITGANDTYIILDTETTGANFKAKGTEGYTGNVWEVAAIKYKNGKEIDRLELLLNKNMLFDGNGKLKPHHSGQKFKHGYNWFGKDVAEAVKRKIDKFTDSTDATNQLKEFMGSTNIIAKNAGFDVDALRYTFGEDIIADKQVYDYDIKTGLEKLVAKYAADEDKVVSTGPAHSALTDVENTYYVLKYTNKLGTAKAEAKNQKTSANKTPETGTYIDFKDEISKISTFSDMRDFLINIANKKMYGLDAEHADLIKSTLARYAQGKLPDILSGKKFFWKDGKIILGAADKETTNRYVELILHEVEHDLTANYIRSKEGQKSNEFKYMSRMVDKLEQIILSGSVTEDTRDRINYVVQQKDKANAVAELTAILRAEPKFAEEISNVVYGETKTGFVTRLLTAVKNLVKKALGKNDKLSFENTAIALESFRNNNVRDKTGKAGLSAGIGKKSAVGLINAATAGMLGKVFTTSAYVVGPLVGRAHNELKRISTYRGVSNLIKHGMWNSKFAAKLRTSLGVDDSVPEKVLKELLAIGNDITQKSYKILTEDIPQLRSGINAVYKSKAKQKMINKIFAKTGLAYLLVDSKAEKALLGNSSIEDMLAKFKPTHRQEVYAEEIAEFYNTGKLGANMYTNSYGILFTGSGLNELEFNQYVALKALGKIDGGLELLRDMNSKHNNVYTALRETVLQVKATSEKLKEDSDFEGHFTLDVTDKVYEYKLVPPGVANEVKYAGSQWKKVDNGMPKGYDVYMRELDSGFIAKGIGISTERFTNGQRLQTTWVKEQLKKDPGFLEKNNISTSFKDGKRVYKLNLTEKLKEKELSLVNDVSESLFRTLVQNKEMIEMETLKDIIRKKAIMKVDSSNVKELGMEIRRHKLGKKTKKPIPMFVKFDKDLGEIPKEIKDFYATPEGKVSHFNDFHKSFDVVRADMKHILLDSEPTALFKQGTIPRKAENIYRHLVSMFKIRLIANPAKLLGDAAANSVLLADVPLEAMTKYGKEYPREMEKLTAYRNKKIELELKELSNPGQYTKQLAAIDKKIKGSKMYPALKHGFVQSLSTGMLLKDFESIRGLQKDLDTVLDKLLNINEKERTWLGTIVEKFSKAGFQGEDAIRAIARTTKSSKIVSKELEAIAGRLEKMKNDGDIVRYVGELLGSPSSEFVRQSSNTMVNIDGVSRWILYNHLMDTGVDEEKAAKQALDTFIDYRVNLPEEVKILSDLGILLFPNFWMKYQRVLYKLLKDSPVSGTAGYAIEELLGMGGNHPLDSNILHKLMSGTVAGVVDPLDDKIYNAYWWLF